MRKQCKRVKRGKGHILIDTQVQKLVLPLHVALTLLPLGLFTREHADSLAKTINIVFVDAGDKHVQAHSHASKAGEVLCSMFKRVKEGKSWNVTADERDMLMQAVIGMDKHVRTMTTNRLLVAAITVDRLNAEAKAAGYGFLDQAPVRKACA